LEKRSDTEAVVPGHWLELRSRSKQVVAHHHPCTQHPPLRDVPRPTSMSVLGHPPFVQLLVLQTGSVVVVT